MATKYILVGGYPYKAADGGKAFAEVLVADFEKPVKILDCLFARPVENWSKAFAEDQDFFAHHLPDKKLEFQLADPNKFTEQVRWTHADYNAPNVNWDKVYSELKDYKENLPILPLAEGQFEVRVR